MRPRTLLSWVWTFSATAVVNAALHQDFSEVQGIVFDFVIIGGGTAGNVIANRLTENPKFKVLVLEAGPSNEGVINSQIPWFAPQLWGSAYDWNYTTVAQPGLNNKTSIFPRGHLLGGTSSSNFLIYTRGSKDIYDDYARTVEDQGWSWNNLQNYFRKNERWTQPADRHNTTGQFNPAVHSFNGINAVSLAGFPTSVDRRIVSAANQLGGPFKFNLDYSSGNPLGVGWLQTTIDGAFRSSSATSYLGPKFINRPNLHVVVNAQVSRVLQTSNGRVPAFRAVEFRQGATTPLKRVTASKEVILSAGAIGSPHILLNSGIGDASALKTAGVKAIVDLPPVGQNFADHVAIANPWLVKGNNTFEFIRDPTQSEVLFNQWKNSGTGPLVDTLLSHLAFFKSNFTSPTPRKRPGHQMPVDATSPHYEFLLSNGLVLPNPRVPPDGHFFSIVTGVIAPASTGSISLKSNNPFDAPLIDPGYYTQRVDVLTMMEAVRQAFKYLSAPAWSDYIVGPTGGLEDISTDADLEAYVINNTGTFFHPTSSNRMSPKGTKTGVVDPDLTVKGVDGLRIIDASVFPYIFSGHPQAAVYVWAERAADIIKVSYP